MKISAIKTYPTLIGRNQLIVKVETDTGLHGWGESGLSSRERAVEGAIAHFRTFLIGQDPLNIGALWQEMYRSNYFEGGRVLTAAISAIDIALHDIKGKALGVPVYQLLGGRQRDYVPLFAHTSAPMGPALLDDVRKLLDQGWNVIRTWIHGPAERDAAGRPIFEPRESIAETATWMTRLREAVGSAPVIGVDYHHRLSVAEAASFCQRLPRGTLDFLEEPIRDETPEAYESLRTMTEIPFAIGEEFASKWQFLPYIERGITQYARVDVCNVGGLTEAMKVAGWCEAHYIDLMPHNPLGAIGTAATAHLATAVANFAWMEIRSSPTEALGFNDPAYFPVQVRQDGPRLYVDDTPGLGVEFDEERSSRATFSIDRTIFLRRRDGSITNI
ncbi:MAG: mandelate racemase/muconate lactonizing enzyme family protein [Chloroflexi bacterium]|nr:mandelate racemase/muconate lactonizing enzyme family protein [Chloroflexota bacterium]